MTCIESIDRMDAALDGALPEEIRSGFHDHLGECPACRNYFEQLGLTVRALGRLAARPEANPGRAALLELFRRGRRNDPD